MGSGACYSPQKIRLGRGSGCRKLLERVTEKTARPQPSQKARQPLNPSSRGQIVIR